MEHERIQIEGIFGLEALEDSGQARILRIEAEDPSTLFVRLQSWDDTHQHSELVPFEGKFVRITIETVEPN